MQTARSSNLQRWDLAGDRAHQRSRRGRYRVPRGRRPRSNGRTRRCCTTRSARSRRTACASRWPRANVTGRSLPRRLDGSVGVRWHQRDRPEPVPRRERSAVPALQGRRPARIYSRPLNADGRSFSGPAQLMLTPTQRWESGVVEAPSMMRTGSQHWLFYSGNDWNSRSYGEGVARCDGPAGPCQARSARTRCWRRTAEVVSPGGGEVFTDSGGAWWMAYRVPGPTREVSEQPVDANRPDPLRRRRHPGSHPVMRPRIFSRQRARRPDPRLLAIEARSELQPQLMPSHRIGSGSHGGERCPTQGSAGAPCPGARSDRRGCDPRGSSCRRRRRRSRPPTRDALWGRTRPTDTSPGARRAARPIGG